MKLYLNYLLLFIFGINATLFCQYNPSTNSYGNLVVKERITSDLRKDKNVNGITCNPNGFYAVDGNGAIDEYTLVGNTYTYTTILTEPGIISLAYSNNLNFPTFSKSFYGSTTTNVQPIVFNGASWVNTSSNYSSIVYNCGGHDNYLYYTAKYSGSVFSKKILKYDGSALTQIYSRPNRIINVGDLAVDNSGNVWFTSTADTSTFICDSLIVISPTGQIVQQYPFVYSGYNAYGSFILNNVGYIGLGPSNVTSPNTLLPISIVSNSVVVGTPISMPANNYADLAGCNAGFPLSLKAESIKEQISIYPNPCTDFLELNFENNKQSFDLKIINAIGQVVFEGDFNNAKTKIDLKDLSYGVYFLKIQNTSGQKMIKFIKQ